MRIAAQLALVVTLAADPAVADPVSIPAPPNPPKPAPEVRYTGGDGSSCQKAVEIAGASGEIQGVRAERWWIYSRYPRATITRQELSTVKDRDYETITFSPEPNKSMTVCFDITSFFGKP